MEAPAVLLMKRRNSHSSDGCYYQIGTSRVITSVHFGASVLCITVRAKGQTTASDWSIALCLVHNHVEGLRPAAHVTLHSFAGTAFGGSTSLFLR